jgi:hypothetical protein
MSNFAVNKPEFVNNTKVMDDLISGNTVFNENITSNIVNQQNYFEVLNDNAKSFDNHGLITPYDATIKYDFFYAVKDSYLINGQSWDDTVAALKERVSEDIPTLTIE